MHPNQVDGIVNLVVELKYKEVFDASEIEWFKVGIRGLLLSGIWPYKRALADG